MKKNFSFKLTACLVSLFVSLLVVILGNKNQYCLSFGFILLGFSVVLFVFYSDEKTTKTIIEIDNEIENIENDDTIEEEEKTYALQQYYLREAKLLKHQKKVRVTFYLCGALFVLWGIIGIF